MLDVPAATEYTWLRRATTENDLVNIYNMITTESMKICKQSDESISLEKFLKLNRRFLTTESAGFWFISDEPHEQYRIFVVGFVWKKRFNLHVVFGAIHKDFDLSTFNQVILDLKVLQESFLCDRIVLCISKKVSFEELLLQYADKVEFPQFAEDDQDEYVIK